MCFENTSKQDSTLPGDVNAEQCVHHVLQGVLPKCVLRVNLQRPLPLECINALRNEVKHWRQLPIAEETTSG